MFNTAMAAAYTAIRPYIYVQVGTLTRRQEIPSADVIHNKKGFVDR